MHKKGDLAFKYLVLMILALVVLIVVLIMFTKGFDYLFDQVRWVLRSVISMKPEGL